MTERVPIYGSMTRPASPEEGLAELERGMLEWRGGEIEITYETSEFTCVCPSTGQPDFSTVKITYVPDELYIESKHMKFYLWSFRDCGIHCEYLADRLASEIASVTKAQSVRVEVAQNPRGGLALRAVRTIVR